MFHTLVKTNRPSMMVAAAWATAALLLAAGPTLVEAATIGNLVYVDTDGNGFYDAASGETGLGGVTIQLYKTGADGVPGGDDDVYVTQTASSATGEYSFPGLAVDNYYLVFTAPPGRIFTLYQQAGDPARDNDADRNGRTATIAVADVSTFYDQIDCGLVSPSSVGNRIFVDSDADGIQDTGEPGLAGVTVRLFDVTPTQTDVVMSQSDGTYLFQNVLHGTQHIEIDLPATYFFSPQDQGADDTADSDVNAGGVSANFVLTVGQSDMTRDAGLYKKAQVSGRIFRDQDGDGLRDTGDGDISATGTATVGLYTVGADGQVGTGDDVQQGANQVTSNTYSFTDLVPGWYYLQIAPPAPLVIVVKDRGDDDTVDSDFNTTGRTEPFQLTSGENDNTIDCGLAVLSGIGDFVFFDANGNGIQDGGETGVANALIFLYQPGPNGVAGDADDDLYGTAQTDAAGWYRFNVVPGNYFLEFHPPNGYSLTLADQGSDDAKDSDAEPVTRLTAIFALTATANDLTRDAGLVADADGDGTPDSADLCPDDPSKTEPGVCGCGKSDADSDGDGIVNCQDNCPRDYNPSQSDADGDGVGDACEFRGTTAEEEEAAVAGLPDLPRDADTTQADETATTDLLTELGPGCGACGTISLVGYLLSVASYGTFLVLRRRR